ncbi:MAG: flavodoxin family protein [Bacteroidales bacterium]|jgi:multimeric flavodoxin WrbA|nr:flavodoxin family protein [Bacteroidales bacterium]
MKQHQTPKTIHLQKYCKWVGVMAIALLLGAAAPCKMTETAPTKVSENNLPPTTIEIIAINGSPRTNGNTAEMCNHFLEGAISANANVHTTIINLYELDFKGCKSCFACKLKNNSSYGHCIVEDGITKLIEQVSQADGVVFASPIYLGDITGEMRSFLERLLFPYLTYQQEPRSVAPKRMQTAMIYTMNVTEQGYYDQKYDEKLAVMENVIGRIFQQPVSICAFNTYQFDDYSRYYADRFSEPDKASYKTEHWALDCQKAFDAGKAMVETILK